MDITSEPLSVIADNYSETCALCTKEHNLLEKSRQKCLRVSLKGKSDYFNFKIEPKFNHVAHLQDINLATKCLK